MFHRVVNMPRALNITGLLLCLWFETCQSFEYIRILNMSGSKVCHGSEYARVTQGSECASIGLNNS